MKAVRIHAFGGPQQLVYEEVPAPEPGAGEVQVRVEAIGVNFTEIQTRLGVRKEPLPNIIGREGAGTVTRLGTGVAGIAVGDRVAFFGGFHTYAEVAVVPAGRAVAIPEGLETATAAAVLLQGMTAHYLSHDCHLLRPGERCLVHAGAGGTGLLLIQMAKALGAEVFTTVSTPEKAARARAAGADHVILYTRTDFAEDVVRIAGGKKVDVVYDAVGRPTFLKGLDVLRPRGRMVMYGRAGGEVDGFDLNTLSAKGSLYFQYAGLVDYVRSDEALQARAAAVFGMVLDGTVKVHIWKRFPLAEASAAQAALEGRASTGKILLIP